MDASSNDITDPAPLSADPPGDPGEGGSDEPASRETVLSDPADVAAADSDAAGEVWEVLDVTRRRVDGLAGLDPAEMVGPAAEIADALGRLIEEDDR